MRRLMLLVAVTLLVHGSDQPLVQPPRPHETERKAGRWTPAPGPYYGPRRDR